MKVTITSEQKARADENISELEDLLDLFTECDESIYGDTCAAFKADLARLQTFLFLSTQEIPR